MGDLCRQAPETQQEAHFNKGMPTRVVVKGFKETTTSEDNLAAIVDGNVYI